MSLYCVRVTDSYDSRLTVIRQGGQCDARLEK